MRLSELNDSTLADMEAHIRSIYEEAWEELHDIEAEYWEDFQIRDAEMQAAIEDGTYPIPDGYTPEQYYAQWRINQIGRDDRWIALRERMASRMVNADSVAASYINDTTPGIYTLNANYTSYTIEQLANSHDLGNGASAGGIAFDIVDEQTVKRLITEVVQLFPAPKIDIPKDMQWNRDALQRCLVSNILQGKSISAIAKGFQFVTGMDQNSAIRSARTAVTGAQNAGRVASYNQAEAMGIEMEMQWMCTLDDRTRSAHQQLDGVRVKPKEKFSGHGLQWPIAYPGDSSGAPKDVYNCRCTLIGVIPGLNDDRGSFKRRAAYYVEDPDDQDNRYKQYDVIAGYTYQAEAGTKSYAEWLNDKMGKAVVPVIDKQEQPAAEYVDEMTGEVYSELKIGNPNVGSIDDIAFDPAKTIAEAEEYAKRFADSVDYTGLKLDAANEVNRTLTYMQAKYGMGGLLEIDANEKKAIASAGITMNGANAGHISLHVNKNQILRGWSQANQNSFDANMQSSRTALAEFEKRLKGGVYGKPGTKVYNDMYARYQRAAYDASHERWHVGAEKGVDTSKTGRQQHAQTMIMHECWHLITFEHCDGNDKKLSEPFKYANECYTYARKSGFSVSKYGATNTDEFIAECGAAYERGEDLPVYVLKMLEVISNA